MDTRSSDWYGLYCERWGDDIVPDAYAHPAKYARGLIRRIYRHLLDEGYLKPGDTVLDPFGGVALGALDAMRHGLHWRGNELEEKFVKLGRQNLLLWDRRYRSLWPDTWGSAVLTQGDSRELSRVQVEGVVSSPPWEESVGSAFGAPETITIRPYLPQKEQVSDYLKQRRLELGMAQKEIAQHFPSATGGLTGCVANWELGLNMPTAEQWRQLKRLLSLDDRFDRGMLTEVEAQAKGRSTTGNTGHAKMTTYGTSPGQLGTMPQGDHDAVVSSPPFGEGETRDRSPVQAGHVADCITRAYTQDKQGTTPGNLAHMEADEEGLEAVVSSPPYAAGCAHTGGADPKPEHIEGGELRFVEYGDTEGQLGTMPQGDHDAVVSSPPMVDSTAGRGQDDLTKSKGLGQDYDERLQYDKRGFLMGKDEYQEWAQTCNLGSFRNATDDFWTAARQIVDQCYLLLKPGAVAVWVVKRFVRDKQIVDFPDRWRRMC